MTKSKRIHVTKRNDSWVAKRENSKRVSSTHNTQRDAEQVAKDIARREKGEVITHRPNGRIRDSDSYGNDPNPPKDKKH